MNKQSNYKHDKPMFPWVIVAPDGLRWLGLAMNEHHAWQFALGWPDQKEIQDHKEQLGWYASEATCTWKREPYFKFRECEDSQLKEKNT